MRIIQAAFLPLLLCLACGPGKDSGDEAAGEMAPQPETEQDEMQESRTNLNLRKWENGVDFYASGNEPFWSLDLDLDKMFTFSTPEGVAYRAPAVQPDLAQGAPVRRYRTVTESGEMIVNLSEGECHDDMSGWAFSHRVRVELKLGADSEYTTYQGCGRYVVPPALHDIWALESFRGEAVDPEGMPRGVPTLEFNSGDFRVTGHSGCNNLNGSFSLMGPNSLQFSQMVSTRRACPDMTLETAFLKALSNRRLDMALAEGRLVLSQRGDEVARFRKVD